MLYSILGLLLLSFTQRGSALPLQAALVQCTCNESIRSIASIVWSCLTTIFACTWVAVHPNLPCQNDSDWAIYRRRARILIVALVVPEYIILWAANQFRSARRAVKELHRFPACKHWTITHGMFLVMGGFVLTDESGKRIGSLQDKDIANLLSTGQVATSAVSCTESEIMDRSKGDAITKTLAMIQTTWFIIQVISRVIQHLPITEIELTTLAFASLNFLTYILWWKKPLEVRHPILISLRGPESMPEARFARNTLYDVEDLEVDITEGQWEKSDSQSTCSSCHGGVSDFFRERSIHLKTWGQASLMRAPHTIWASLNVITRTFIRPWPLQMADSQSKTLPTSAPSIPASSPGSESTSYSLPTLEFTSCVPTFYGGPRLIVTHGIGPIYPTTLEMLIGCLFGALHCAAWRFRFPSTGEQVLCRCASVCMTGAPLALCFMWLLIKILWPPDTKFSIDYARNGVSQKIVTFFIRWTRPFHVIFIFYLLSRVTTFILMFIDLRELPPGALQEVQWTNFIPHV